MKTVLLLISFILASVHLAEAQQSGKIPRLGFLSILPAQANATRVQAFRQALSDLGYVEGQNIALEWRYADGKIDQLPQLAAELVRLRVDVIITGGPAATYPAMKATKTIPIVMAFDTDPVGSGLVASLARPGGNVTGLSSLSPDISGKQVELLKEIVPQLSRIAVFGDLNRRDTGQALKEAELAAGMFGIKLKYLDIRVPKDIETAFETASKERADAVLLLPSPFTLSHRRQAVEFASTSRLPTIYWATEFVEAGGLMTYSVNFTDLFRRAATYVNKILKGAKPRDLPIEQATKFELVINLQAAKQIGLTIPPNVLARADKVIK